MPTCYWSPGSWAPQPGSPVPSRCRPWSLGAGPPGACACWLRSLGSFRWTPPWFYGRRRFFFFSFLCSLGYLKEIKKFCFTIDSDVLHMDFLKNQNEHNGFKSVFFLKYFEDGGAFGCVSPGLTGQLFLRRWPMPLGKAHQDPCHAASLPSGRHDHCLFSVPRPRWQRKSGVAGGIASGCGDAEDVGMAGPGGNPHMPGSPSWKRLPRK